MVLGTVVLLVAPSGCGGCDHIGGGDNDGDGGGDTNGGGGSIF